MASIIHHSVKKAVETRSTEDILPKSKLPQSPQKAESEQWHKEKIQSPPSNVEIEFPEFLDYRTSYTIPVSVSNPSEEVVENLVIDFSDASNYFKISEKEIKFPPLKPNTKLEREIELKPLFKGEISFVVKIRTEVGESIKEFKVEVGSGTRVYGDGE